MKSSLFTNTSVDCFFFLLVCDLSSRFKIVLVLLLRSGRKKNCINMFALFLFFIFHTITFCSVSKVIKCIKVKNKYAVSNKIEKNSSTDNINTGLWFTWLPISEMFCIFSAISLQRASNMTAAEKGLRHFSFSDFFGFCEISGHISPSKNPQAPRLAILFAQDQISDDHFEGTNPYLWKMEPWLSDS